MNSKRILAACDIGTSSVKVVVSQNIGGSLNILGVGVAPSEGIKRGQIVDISQAVASINKAVAQAEEMTGLEISTIYVGIGAFQTQVQKCEGVVAVNSEDRKITNEDKHKVRKQAELIQVPHDRTIIDVVPLTYKVDELEDVVDPLGMSGVRLEMKGIIITGLKTAVNNTISVIESAGLEIAGIGYLPYTTGELALSVEEKEMGVALIEIGGGTTSVTYFKDSEIQSSFLLPIGGENITKDLSQVLKTSIVDAEALKLKYGNAFYDFKLPEEGINIKEMGTEKVKQVNISTVCEIIEARLSEIFKMVDAEFQRQGIESSITNVVLTGGTLKMAGVKDLAEHALQKPARVYTPNIISVREPQYTVNASMLTSEFSRARIEGRNVKDCTGSRQKNTGQQRSQKLVKSTSKKSNVKNVQKNKESNGENATSGVKKWLSNLFD